jgi:hypothetical protein
MNRKGFFLIVSAALAVSACAGERGAAARGPRVVIGFEAGPSYRALHWSGIFPMVVRPQMAAWLENADGFVETVYVTDKVVREAWIGGIPRPEALPVWRAASAGSRSTDAVSGATPASGAERTREISPVLPAGEYVVMLEVNSSFDFNSAYTEAGGVNGQPSVVYSGRIAVGMPGSRAELAPIGTGSLDGSSGEVRPGVGGLTTALELILHPFAEYRE